MSILVITSRLDLTADEVIRGLTNKGESVYRLNTDDLCSTHNLELYIDTLEFDGSFNTSFREIKFRDIKSVYYRKPSLPIRCSENPQVDKFIRDEIDLFLKWLWISLGDRFWVSDPTCIKSAESKFSQLRIAPSLGFRIPRTLITNRPEKVREFFNSCGGKMINKVLGTVTYKEGEQAYHIFCRSVSLPEIESGGSISLLPCFFQERVEKEVELRITVVGDLVFPCEIHSQQSDKTKEDWRNYDLENTPHRVHNLPKNIADQCRSLLHHYSLKYGAIDMILTPQGEYVFLEINPNGQYGWIEKLTGLPITQAIVDLLVSV